MLIQMDEEYDDEDNADDYDDDDKFGMKGE